MGDAAEREHGRPRGGRRGRDAAATRAAILEAARGAFTRESYDQVGVREIATVAGIDAALVIRYFGSKEGLFAAAIGKKFDLSLLFEGDARGLGERVARAVLLKPKAAGELDPMLILLRSAAPIGGIWKKWSITQRESSPVASAARAMSAKAGPMAAGPPAWSKIGTWIPMRIVLPRAW